MINMTSIHHHQLHLFLHSAQHRSAPSSCTDRTVPWKSIIASMNIYCSYSASQTLKYENSGQDLQDHKTPSHTSQWRFTRIYSYPVYINILRDPQTIALFTPQIYSIFIIFLDCYLYSYFVYFLTVFKRFCPTNFTTCFYLFVYLVFTLALCVASLPLNLTPFTALYCTQISYHTHIDVQ